MLKSRLRMAWYGGDRCLLFVDGALCRQIESIQNLIQDCFKTVGYAVCECDVS